MIVRPAVILSSLLFASIALALALPQVENGSGDVNAEDTSPVQALEVLFEKIIEGNPPVKTTRNELINGECNDIIIIYARGTTEAGNVGPEVGPLFFSNLTQIRPGKVLVQGVDYRADVWGYLLGGSDSGAKNMANLIGRAASQCPTSKIVLSGYSQGAQVTHKAANLISSSLYPKIAAIVVFGDPKKGTPFPGSLNNNVKTFCNNGDLICDGLPLPTPEHLTYENNAPEAAAFVASRT